jgi:hypothetical protein
VLADRHMEEDGPDAEDDGELQDIPVPPPHFPDGESDSDCDRAGDGPDRDSERRRYLLLEHQ